MPSARVTPIASVAIKARIDTRSPACISATAPGRRATCCSPWTAGTSKRHQKGQAVLDGAQAQLERADATSSVTPNWSPKTPRRWSRSTMPDPGHYFARAAAIPTRATAENLKIQLGYCTIRAPITGRISMANVKVGNFVRQADTRRWRPSSRPRRSMSPSRFRKEICRSPSRARGRKRDRRAAMPGDESRRRAGDDDREQRRRDDRNGDGARHMPNPEEVFGRGRW